MKLADHDNACCVSVEPPRYVADVLRRLADDVPSENCGYGVPVPPALSGLKVLCVGRGTQREAVIVEELVGSDGSVATIDALTDAEGLTDEARALADGSFDLVVANCAFSTECDRDSALECAARVLVPGGELFSSDLFCHPSPPKEWVEDPELVEEGFAGAFYADDFEQRLVKAGFIGALTVSTERVKVMNLNMQTKVRFHLFELGTWRAIKDGGKALPDAIEGEGNVCVRYLGTIPEQPRYFDWSDGLRFVKGKPKIISPSETALIAQSRYKAFFSYEAAEPGAVVVPAKEHRDKPFSMEDSSSIVIDKEFLDDAYKRLGYKSFEERVGEPELLMTHEKLITMQMNITYRCNIACRHCFLESGPTRPEIMSHETMEDCIRAFKAGGFESIDITGGSPELHPDLEWLICEFSGIAKEIIVRTNLTMLDLPKYSHLVDLFAEMGVRIIASLPFYTEQGADDQRGKGVFERAMRGIRELNKRGYGMGRGLVLDLMFNAGGPYLPPPQSKIEEAYRARLEKEQGIHFDSLLALNNFCLGRYAHDLIESGTFDAYLSLLANNYNALAVTRTMCLSQASVDYDGRIYDCEPNHALSMPRQIDGRDMTIKDLVSGQLPPRKILTNAICYSCVAGSGSSCGGSLV
ncbi:MAG: arsenosugar biosynthesis radical SAM protein ArsS [Eggerthellaceae bacterium]|nr:arsenosugar biosynthesis radical SAM protein ArsS [Eggerthellaceae bacterium]